MSNLHVVILTKDEGRHLGRLLARLRGDCRFAGPIVVIDSRSEDDTREIARSQGCIVYNRRFINQNETLDWYLGMRQWCRDDWLLRIDADELISPQGFADITALCESFNDSSTCAGFSLRRRIVHFGRELRFGGTQINIVRAVRPSVTVLDGRPMDERFVPMKGFSFHTSSIPFTDHSLLSTKEFLDKQVNYAVRESESILDNGTDQSRDNRRMSYYRAPILLRPFLLLFFRYFVQLGFLDGIAGLRFLLINTLIYRLMVDVIILEKKRYDRSK